MDKNFELFKACIGKDNETIKKLAEEGQDFNVMLPNDQTPFMTVARLGNAEGVRIMLEHGADPIMKDRYGKNLLENYFGYNGDVKKAINDFYLSHPEVADPRVLTMENNPEEYRQAVDDLHMACILGQADKVKDYVLIYKIDVNAYDPQSHETPVFAATRLGYEDVVAFLLENGADPFLTDKYGKTAVDEIGKSATMKSIYDRHFQSSKTQSGEADATKSDSGLKYAYSMLLDGCQDMNLDKIKTAVELGADLNAIYEASGQRYVSQAFRTWCADPKVVKFLFDNGFDPTIKDAHGARIITKDIYERFKPEIQNLFKEYFTSHPEKLASFAVSPENTEEYQEALSSLRSAIVFDELDEVKVGLDVKKIDANSIIENKSLLMLACEMGKKETISLLLDRGADPFMEVNGESCTSNFKRYRSSTQEALRAHFKTHPMTDEQKEQIVSINSEMLISALWLIDNAKIRMLVEGGNIDLNHQSNDTGECPLEIARDPQTFAYLIENGADPTAKNRDGEAVIDNYISLDDASRKAIDMYFVEHPDLEDPRIIDPDKDPKKYREMVKTLSTSCRLGDLDRVKVLVNVYKIDPNELNQYGETAIYTASMNDEPEVVAFLLENGADPTVPNKNGRTVFSEIARIDSNEIKYSLNEYVKLHRDVAELEDDDSTHVMPSIDELDPALEVFEDEPRDEAEEEDDEKHDDDYDEYMKSEIESFVEQEDLDAPVNPIAVLNTNLFIATLASSSIDAPSAVMDLLGKAGENYVELSTLEKQCASGWRKTTLDKFDKKPADFKMYKEAMKEIIACAKQLGITPQMSDDFLTTLSVCGKAAWPELKADYLLQVDTQLAKELMINISEQNDDDDQKK